MDISIFHTGNHAVSGFQAKEKAPQHEFKVFDPSQNVTGSEIKAVNTAYGQADISGPIFPSGSQALLLSQQEVNTDEAVSKTYTVNTSKGYRDIDFDAYFSANDGATGPIKLDDVPLLMPSADNITALSEHVSLRFKEMLADLGISAPKSISYNSSGRMILPADYPHSEELRQGLKDNPALERALRTVNALSSHYVELQKLVPFHEEYAAAETQAQIDAVLDKYRHLLNDSRSNSRIALHFSDDGHLELTADGKSVEVA